ncbi:MAG: hypothetical protein RLY30_1719 [Pseudomonadota bacterium]|jgi:hypothetical protein
MPVREMTPEEVLARFGRGRLVIHRRPNPVQEDQQTAVSYGDIAEAVRRDYEKEQEAKRLEAREGEGNE